MTAYAVSEEARAMSGRLGGLGTWCRMSGITYRRLDHWTRTGLLWPANGLTPGSGRPRQWSEAELTVAEMIGRLLAAGLELRVAAKAARALCDGAQSADLAPGVTLTVRAADGSLAGAA